jgi:hypothetical protein
MYRGTPEQQEQRFLHHVFFVNGNGYEWVDGQPVCEDYYDGPLTLDERIEEARKEHEARVKDREEWWRHFVVSSGGNPGLTKEQYFESEPRDKIYPLCHYATILWTPVNVADDWLNAAVNALVYAFTLERTMEDNWWLMMAMFRVQTIAEGRTGIRTDKYGLEAYSATIRLYSLMISHASNPADRSLVNVARYFGLRNHPIFIDIMKEKDSL